MKKVLAILLSLIIAFSSMAIVASAADNDLKVIVASDLHFSANSLTPYTGNTADNMYAHVPSSGQLIYESNAIITAFLDAAADSDAQAILLSGDNINAGTEAEHLLFAAKLADFEKETGKQIYVIPGNHDVFKSSSETFATIYAQFGYADAIAVDTNSISYVADLNDEYRVLGIDSTGEGQGVECMTAERVDWIEAQCKQAAADGKKVIAMMHHNLLEHYIFNDAIHEGAVVDSSLGLAEVLASNGVQYIFTGHTHNQDIASYTAANGKVIYDAVTNSLNGYPVVYRYITFGEDVVFESRNVTKIDTSLLPAGLSADAVALAGSDFTKYAKNCIWYGLRKGFDGYLTPSTLKKLLKLNEEENAEFVAIFDKISTKLCDALKYPLYEKDAETAGKSVEALAKANGDTLTSSNYTDLIDLIITIYQAHCVGDENYPIYSTELEVLSTALSAVLNYALADLTTEEYTTALTFICTMLDVEVPSWIITFASSGLSYGQGVDLLVSGVLMPVMTEFTVDETPADNNVTLPGYGKTTVSSDEGFFSLIMSFFQKIIDFFKSIMTYFKNLI
ncbi:MAG: metallophosphoesterase [Clostridia bacterium]|nr:metallophosphoesterase [Clostridia bacterium]